MTIQIEMRRILEDLGLTKPEITVYLASLERGSASASELADTALMNRVTTYEILKRLSRKGFVKIRAKKNTHGRYFVPAEYDEIVERLKTKQSDLSARLERMESLKTGFQAQFSRLEKKPIVLFYEGIEGAKLVLEDTLCAEVQEILSFASVESLKSGFDTKFLESYWKKRVEKGIVTKGIVPRTEEAVRQFNAEKNHKELRQLRFFSPELYDFSNEIDVYGHNVGIISLNKGSEYGIIIRSRGIAESFRSVFDALWAITIK